MSPRDIQVADSSSPLHRAIGFWSGVGIVVGTTIGSGIFRVPADLARYIGDPRIILSLWVGFGLVSLCGALTLAELACLLPRTGGVYVYLRAAYGDAAAFVFGWLYLLITVPSAMGALAVFFAEMLAHVCGLDAAQAPGIAIATILVLMAANIRGIQPGLFIQNTFALAKVGVLAALIVTVFTLGHGDFGHLTTVASPARTLAGLAAAVYLVMWSNSGWQSLSMVAGEMAHPTRRMTRTLVTGILTIISLYVGANLAYCYVLPVEAIQAEPLVASKVMTLTLGQSGRMAIEFGVLASVFGALNGVMLARSRVAYALASDGLSFAIFARCHSRWATPHVAIAVQGAMAILLVLLLRQFTALTRYFATVEYLALAFAIAAVFILRRTMADAPRPYHTFGYPWVPLVFVTAAIAGVVAITVSAVNERAFAPLIGLGITALGFPIYLLWRGSRNS